jgi:REP element-mobilizing transposase RayT
MSDHALNRANGRLPIFADDGDYAAFECTLAKAVASHDMRLLAYCLMPNHFHLLWPRHDDDLVLRRARPPGAGDLASGIDHLWV